MLIVESHYLEENFELFPGEEFILCIGQRDIRNEVRNTAILAFIDEVFASVSAVSSIRTVINVQHVLKAPSVCGRVRPMNHGQSLHAYDVEFFPYLRAT